MNAVTSLSDKIVVVTGGASGIGRIYSEAIAAAGGSVVIADLDGGPADALATSLRERGAHAIGCTLDIASAASNTELAKLTADHFGRVDGIVNNAALMSALPRRDWTEIPEDEWDRVMSVNLRGVFLTCRALYPLMKDTGGSIVNVASTRALDGTPNRLHYTTSKAGIVGFTKALAREVGSQSIRVNCIAPGITLSDTQIASSDPDYLVALGAGRALPRQQQPDDLVGAVLFLLSDASQFISGQTLVVDGGRLMH